MPNKTGLDVAQYVKNSQLETKVIVLTTFGRSGYLRRALDHGVKGFLLKNSKLLLIHINKIFFFS